MKIDIIISASDIKEEKIKDKTVIIIDMLRATSVIITALNNGCNKVIPVISVDEAISIASKDKNKCILGGERNAIKIEGFDFSNSPIEYTTERVKNKTLIMTTTNGTMAINKSLKARKLLIGALINAKFAAQRALELNEDVVIINSGTAGQFSIDDFICSGYIIDCLIKRKDDIFLTDIAKVSHYIYENNKDIISFIKNANHYNVLKKLNLMDDLKYCCQKDIIQIVPEYNNGELYVNKTVK